jgi:hypothetical protein
MTRLWTACVLASLLAACACKNKTDTGPGGGNGSGTGGAVRCEEIKAHVEKLYRAEATGEDIDEQVADNTQMVMNDCERKPEAVATCARDATSVADLEQRCLIPLDQEGSEGDVFSGKTK